MSLISDKCTFKSHGVSVWQKGLRGPLPWHIHGLVQKLNELFTPSRFFSGDEAFGDTINGRERDPAMEQTTLAGKL